MAIEERAWSIVWDYYELVKYNSLLSLNSYADYSSIEITANLFDRDKSPTEVILSFNVTSESPGWYYHMYAFKITGGFWGMNKISFIHTDRNDKTKPFNAKNNSIIKEITSVNAKINYNKTHKYIIKFEGENVSLYIDDDKIISTYFPDKKQEGRIGISSRNVKIAIDKIIVKKGEAVIFTDDFNIDTIFVKTVKAKKTSTTDGNNSATQQLPK